MDNYPISIFLIDARNKTPSIMMLQYLEENPDPTIAAVSSGLILRTIWSCWSPTGWSASAASPSSRAQHDGRVGPRRAARCRRRCCRAWTDGVS
jgi:hypothetical protein